MNNNRTTLLALLLFGFCFVSCSQDDARQNADGIAVGFTLPGIGGEVTEDGLTRAALATDTKVRLVVYKTGAQSGADYVATKDYTAQADGSLKATDGADLRLIDGTYDFYTYTPDLAVITTGTVPAVGVAHGADFASSLTENQTVVKWNTAEGSAAQRSIVLSPLERKCAQLAFQLNVNGSIINNLPVKKVAITEAKFTGMADAPLTATGAGDLPAATTSTAEVTMDESSFATDDLKPTLSSGSGVVLPKPAGSFGVKLKARFNDGGMLDFESASIANLELKKGYRYAFIATWQEGKFVLHLVVAPWTSAGINADLGGTGVKTYPLGEWTTTTILGDIGSSGATLTVTGWTASSSWTGDIGSSGADIGALPGWTFTEIVSSIGKE